jgi:hypothetical protein
MHRTRTQVLGSVPNGIRSGSGGVDQTQTTSSIQMMFLTFWIHITRHALSMYRTRTVRVRPYTYMSEPERLGFGTCLAILENCVTVTILQISTSDMYPRILGTSSGCSMLLEFGRHLPNPNVRVRCMPIRN